MNKDGGFQSKEIRKIEEFDKSDMLLRSIIRLKVNFTVFFLMQAWVNQKMLGNS